MNDKNMVLLVHGGAGVINKDLITEQQDKEYRETLNQALNQGFKELESGQSSVDAVIQAIKILEDSKLFNAGRGSVYSSSGKIMMEASIMDGKTKMSGGVTGVQTIKNPILAAQTVMNKSRHCLLFGTGAEEFAIQNGCQQQNTDYFQTDHRFQQWQLLQSIGKDLTALDNDVVYKCGTVGAVALDSFGNLAAGTSTGGMTNKMDSRVGDAVIIGGVSCTGHGEKFMRCVAAHDISAQIEYGGVSLHQAAKNLIFQKLEGDGGCIAVDSKGNYCMPYNTRGMFRGVRTSQEQGKVYIFDR